MVKESSGDIQRMHRIHELSQKTLPFYNGCNPLALEAFCAGASGWCTAAPNLLSKRPYHVYQYMKDGNVQAARDEFYSQLPLLRFIVQNGLPKIIKAGLNHLSFSVGTPRRPIKPVNEVEFAELKALMKHPN